MFVKTYGVTALGIDGRIIDVEVDVSPGVAGVWDGGTSRYVAEGVEGAGDSPSRLAIFTEYRSGIVVFAAIFHQKQEYIS